MHTTVRYGLLIDSGGDLKLKNYEGETPLPLALDCYRHFSLGASQLEGSAKWCVETLLSRRARLSDISLYQGSG